MSNLAELSIVAAVGDSLGAATLFAAQPAELEGSYRSHRTFVLVLDERRRPRLRETLTYPVHHAWQAPGGSIYCPQNGGVLMVFDGKAWTRQDLGTSGEEVRGLFGLTDGNKLTLYVSGLDTLCIGQEGRFHNIELSGDSRGLSWIHGLAADEIYGANGSLWLWDGCGVTEVDTPKENILAVHVASAETLWAVGRRYVYRWTDGKGWTRLKEADGDHSIGIHAFGDSLFIADWTGVVRIRDYQSRPVVERSVDFSCPSLFRLGDHLLGSGDQGTFLFDGTNWQRLELPRLEKNAPFK